MDAGIEELLSAVVTAITPIAGRLQPQPTVSEFAAVLRLLGEPCVEFRPGEPPQRVLERIRRLEALLADGASIR